jgi:phage shock protein C
MISDGSHRNLLEISDTLNDREAHMTKKFYRSKKDRVIAGVCGGIAEYFDIDPIIVRLIALSLVLSAGGGIIAYIIAWIAVPIEPEDQYPVSVQ